MSYDLEIISISSQSVSAEVPVEFVLSSASPSLFVEHCIHANELNDFGCVHVPILSACKLKRIGTVQKSASTANVVVGVPKGSP